MLEFDGVTAGVQLMQYEVVISPSYAVEIHYNNGYDGSTLIFDPLMYHGTGVVLALDKQCVRLYCLNLTRVIAV